MKAAKHLGTTPCNPHVEEDTTKFAQKGPPIFGGPFRIFLFRFQYALHRRGGFHAGAINESRVPLDSPTKTA
jgi:hypothetical protein